MFLLYKYWYNYQTNPANGSFSHFLRYQVKFASSLVLYLQSERFLMVQNKKLPNLLFPVKVPSASFFRFFFFFFFFFSCFEKMASFAQNVSTILLCPLKKRLLLNNLLWTLISSEWWQSTAVWNVHFLSRWSCSGLTQSGTVSALFQWGDHGPRKDRLLNSIITLDPEAYDQPSLCTSDLRI